MSSKKIGKTVLKMVNNIPHIGKKPMVIFIVLGILILIVYSLKTLYPNSYKEGMITLFPKKTGDCDKIDKAYREKTTKVESVFGDKTRFLLRDYYIKAAYSACSTGKFHGGYVDTCALKHCIKQGARFLDFEIYSVDGEPVVACSANRENEPTMKGSYNHIPFDIVMRTVNDYAFISKHSPVHEDPLLLHFRIKIIDENLAPVYDKMADIIVKKLGTKLLNRNYVNEFNGKNLGDNSIDSFKGKAIIIVDASNELFRTTRLKEITNTSTNSLYARLYKYDSMSNIDEDDDLVEYNKRNMTFCIPKSGSRPLNPDFSESSKLGTQVLAMCYQEYDTNMEAYHEYFNSNQRSFILKPTDLRAPIEVEPEIVQQDPTYSYANREVGLGIPGDEVDYVV